VMTPRGVANIVRHFAGVSNSLPGAHPRSLRAAQGANVHAVNGV